MAEPKVLKKHRELGLLFKETVSLYLRLSADASAIYGRGELSGPRRTLLVALASTGPQTAARLARERSQTRQRLQPLVNALVHDGLVEATTNPMHKRSPLLVLTPKGQAHAREIFATERALIARLRLPTSAGDLRRASDVLRRVRETLEAQMPDLLR